MHTDPLPFEGDHDGIFDGLNAGQVRAVQAVRGPVCILAGAGSGKTTTITRRIAYQVRTGTFDPKAILAVTFTDKAAGEMRARLEALGIPGIRARTFHSAALGQLRALSAEPPEQVLGSKALPLRQIANSLPRPYRFRPAADLATEVEWAKNRRIEPERYLNECGRDGHEPPIPADLMAGVYRTYERRKRARGLVDFEDLLELAVRLFERDAAARDRLRAMYLAFTVDEYQDVNLLQQALLERWLGDRDDLCVVGDDYQSIYGFTGATPEYLLSMPTRFPAATVVRLEENHRSTPEVLAAANRLVPGMGGSRKVLRAVRPPGPAPVARAFPDAAAEGAFVVEGIRALRAEGVPHEEMAVLYRTNLRSEDFEEALSGAGIPFQVRDGAFLNRQAARRLLSALGRVRSADVADAVRTAAGRDGLVGSDELPEGLGEQEMTRQADLARLVKLADEFQRAHADEATMEAFVADLRARFGSDHGGRGVNLLTYHRAKGLEFDAVFLPRLQEGELPFRRARSDQAVAEERRLLYVGITRARVHVTITWLAGGRQPPSRFVAELGLTRRPSPARALVGGGPAPAKEAPDSPMVKALRAWRLERSRADGVPAYVVLHDSTLEEIARLRPSTTSQLAGVSGIGPAKLERYGPDILATLARSDG